MTDHECGCSHFGLGPHDVDLRHPNPRACEHAEYGLDAAWAEAQAALPEGWRIGNITDIRGDDHGPQVWQALAAEDENRDYVGADGPTPAAALRALAARLRADSIVDPSL